MYLHHFAKLSILSLGLLSTLLCGCGSPANPQGDAENVSLSIKGSDTMVHLVTTWSEAYMQAHTSVDISVTGGGSGTGISSLIGKSTDICASSRDMSAEEKKKAAEQGISLKETIVGRDGIAIAVHPSNPIQELDMEQLRKIYTGAITQWDQLGGAAAPLLPLSRESSSGTFVFFQEHVLKKEDFAASVRLMPATAAIIQSISEDANAIGYVGLGYAVEAGAKIKLVPIKKDAGSPAVVPTESTVRDASYSISRPLFFYTGGINPTQVEPFLAFCTGVEGQTIVRESGYVPIQ